MFKLHSETVYTQNILQGCHLCPHFHILRLSFKMYGLNQSFSCEITGMLLRLVLGRLPLVANFKPRLSGDYHFSRLSSCIGRQLYPPKLTVKAMRVESIFMLLYKADTKFSHKSHRDLHQKSIIKPVHQLAG